MIRFETKHKTAEEEGPLKNRENYAGLITGIFLLVIGGTALARSLQLVQVPDWLFNWQVLLIVIGFFIGIRSRFQGAAWFVLILVGSAYLLNDYYFDGDLHTHGWPLIIFCMGIFFILRPRGRSRWGSGVQRKEPYSSARLLGDGDFADITIVFGNAKKYMITPAFAGGDITAIFGGAELDLANADIQGRAVVDITTIFGGAELIIPSDWTVKSEVVSVFGSVKDKRVESTAVQENPNKLLVLDGTAMFGGIVIRSFKK